MSKIIYDRSTRKFARSVDSKGIRYPGDRVDSLNRGHENSKFVNSVQKIADDLDKRKSVSTYMIRHEKAAKENEPNMEDIRGKAFDKVIDNKINKGIVNRVENIFPFYKEDKEFDAIKRLLNTERKYRKSPEIKVRKLA